MPDIKIDPQVIIILVVLIFGALRWAFEQFKRTHFGGGGEDAGEEEEPPTPSSPFEDMYREARREIEERQRGLAPEPDEEATPPTFRPSFEPQVVTPPPLPPALPDTPPVRTAAPAPSFAKPARPKLSSAEQAALERVRVSGLQITRRKSLPRSQSRVRSLLATPSSARDAIVLREILGPPKGVE